MHPYGRAGSWRGRGGGGGIISFGQIPFRVVWTLVSKIFLPGKIQPLPPRGARWATGTPVG